MITQEQLKLLYYYNNGLFNLNNLNPRALKDQRAGYTRPDGYRSVRINKKSYLEHRLIFLFFNGYLPIEIDHINMDKSDNRIENLRECSRSENQYNTKSNKNSTSKFKGVSKCKFGKPWAACIRHKNKTIHLGSYNTEKEAAIVYNNKAKELHGIFYNGN